MVSPIQVLLTIFLLFALSRVYLRAKGGELHFGEFLFWGGIFVFALIGVIEPQFTNYAARILGIGRGADVVMYAAIALVFYLIFRTNVYIENLKHDITLLNRKMALYDHEKGAGRKGANKQATYENSVGN
jgi:hypothetical protein